MSEKIKSQAVLAKIAAALHADGKNIVFTNGCFDILHVGHVDYLTKARKMGDVLVVAINSDRSVKKIKGKDRPINNQADRAKVLSGLSSVDYITIFNEPTPEKIIMKLRPDVLVKGGDWKVEDMIGADFVQEYGGRVVPVPFVKGYSTTGLIKRMAR